MTPFDFSRLSFADLGAIISHSTLAALKNADQCKKTGSEDAQNLSAFYKAVTESARDEMERRIKSKFGTAQIDIQEKYREYMDSKL